MEKITLDLNDLASGKVELASFQQKVTTLDVTLYKDKHVQLVGCAPTWAHLLVAGKLFPVVGALDFLIDDGKEGKPVQIL
ncbi:MAG: hypothetical protein KCHDKBKB_01256 [Elusimicrobia bacterium]|nr:hypothetical protein [Elusimicrobiota bacterium]